MKDIHNHLIYGVDDGAISLEDSIEIVKGLYEEMGVTDIICTPHFVSDSRYSVNNKDKEKKLRRIKDELKKEKIPVNLYLGNEVFLDYDVNGNIKKANIRTLNNSKYILVEFSIYQQGEKITDLIRELTKKGYIPILAHPERYLYIDLDFLDELIEMGVLLQSNIRSITGDYGSQSKKMVKTLLKKDMISFLATDIHKVDDIKHLNRSLKKLKRLLGEDRLEELLNTNFNLIIDKERITS